MIQRILTALVGIPLFLGVLWVGGWPLTALTLALSFLGFFEYARLAAALGVRVIKPVGLAGCAGLIFAAHQALAAGTPALVAWGPSGAVVLTLLVLGALGWQTFAGSGYGLAGAAATVTGVLYTGWLFSHLVLLRGLAGAETALLPGGLGFAALAFGCIWAADSAAYFVGRALGRRRLAPAISPGKTVEGAVGGAVAAVAAGWALAALTPVTAVVGAALGLVIFAAALVGDLAESSLKRQAGVKDSGALLPGHGGVLDRFDSTLFVLPVLYYLLIAAGLTGI